MTSGVAGSPPTRAIANHASLGHPRTAIDQAKTLRAAQDFEAMTLDQMLQPMFATLDTDPLFGGGEAEKTLQPLLITEMAKLMEERGGLGLSGAIDEKMTKLQEIKR